MSHASTNLQVHSVTSPMSDDLTSTPLRGDGLRLRGFPRGGNVIGARDNLICDKEPALGGSLHRVEIILVGVAAGEEEVVDGGGLRGPQPVLPWDLAVESLAEIVLVALNCFYVMTCSISAPPMQLLMVHGTIVMMWVVNRNYGAG